MYKTLQKQIKELKEKDRAREAQHKECVKEIEKLKTMNTSELEGINNKLSDFAQHAIARSKGPVKPEKLVEFFKNDNFGKRNKAILDLIGNYSKNIDGVKKQLSEILETVQNHMAYRKKQKELDDKLMKMLKKSEKIIEKEEEKGIKSDTKFMVQSTLEQCFNWGNVSCKVEVNCNKDQNSPAEGGEQINTCKQGMFGKEEKHNRKRKTRTDDDSSSNQGTGEKHNTSGSNKRLKLSSSRSNTESSNLAELTSDDPAEPMLVVSSESSHSSTNGVKQITSRFSKRLKLSSSRSNTESSNSTEFLSDDPAEPKSVVLSHRSQSSTQPMLIPESNESNAMLVDKSTGKFHEETKTTKKVTGNVHKRSEENAQKYNEEETVYERRFYLRGKPL